MNKSKLISVAVLCALALGACVDDKESASVTALREAKTSYFKSQSDYQAAQAELARINAEVTKAKAESEIKLAELQAKANAAKTEAEAAQIKQQMQQEADRFAAKLAGIEAKAKAEAAQYELQLQEYLNQLAIAQRQAVMDQQGDLVTVIGDYKTALGNIRDAEANVRDYTLQMAKKQQEKAEVLAGDALALAKNAVLKQEAELSANTIILQEYKILKEADAEAQKAKVEELRAGLAEKAEALKAAQDKYLAIDKEIEPINTENRELDKVLNGYDGQDDQGNWHHFLGKLDTLGNAWGDLDNAEQYMHSRPLFNYIGGEGNYSFDNIRDIKYYSWEADKLLADMNKELVALRADSLAVDTLSVAAARLQPLFVALEKAIEANDKAEADKDAKENAFTKAEDVYDQLVADGVTGTKLTEAELAKDKAKEAYLKADSVYSGYQDKDGKWVKGTNEKKADAQNLYEVKRDANHALEIEVARIKEDLEDLIAYIEKVKAAKDICFGTLFAEVDAIYTQRMDNYDKISDLRDKRAELEAEAYALELKYNNDKSIVDSWDSAIKNDFANVLATVEKMINTYEGKVATAEAKLQNLKDILADPEKIDEVYCETLNDEIEALTNKLEEAQETLDAEKAKAAAYKATIDAWSAESAE